MDINKDDKKKRFNSYTNKITCCYNCENRTIACHGNCDEYLTQRKQLNELNEQIHQKKIIENGFRSLNLSDFIGTASTRSKHFKDRRKK